jgi:chitodextrinase
MKRFHSQVQCDRLTACVAIAKALDLDPVTDFSANPFKDMNLISDEDFGYLLALYEAGYINGYPDGNFNPNRLLTRAQIASIIDKLLDDEVISKDDNEPTWDDDSFVTASAVKAESVKLKWSAADDDVKVTGYKIICEVDGDDDKVKYSVDREITIGGLEPEEDYIFTVQARDAAGNWSDDGPYVEVTTLEEEEEEDTEAPEWPDEADLTISSSASGMVTVIWPDATDNVKVESYKLYLDNVLIKTMDEDDNSVNVTGLDSDTSYSFKLKAVDDAGNESSSLTKTYVTD